MNKSTVAIGLLAVALVASNLWWVYQMLDAGVSYGYQSDALQEHKEALAQALAVTKVVAVPGATKEQVVAAVRIEGEDPFEKDGYLWIGRLGLRFDVNGKLVEAVPAWSQ